MNYTNYQQARDAAWRILLDCRIQQLPVDLNTVCRMLGVRAVSYTSFWPDGHVPPQALRTDGMTFYVGDDPVILFAPNRAPERIRFTIAHELGHLVLGHTAPGMITVVNREPAAGDAPIETAANQFAVRLLAPACVLWGLGIHSADEIAALCHISRQSAEFRAARMEDLYRRDRFLTSRMERAVFERFRQFIAEYHHSCR